MVLVESARDGVVVRGLKIVNMQGGGGGNSRAGGSLWLEKEWPVDNLKADKKKVCEPFDDKRLSEKGWEKVTEESK